MVTRKDKRYGIVVVVLALILILPVVEAWFDTDWDFRNPFNVRVNISSDLTNYTAPFVVNTQTLISQGKLQSDCRDIRFVNGSDTGSFIPYEYDDYCNNAKSVFWAGRINLTAGVYNQPNLHYVYYGNSGASNTSTRGVWDGSYTVVAHFPSGDTLKNSANFSLNLSVIGVANTTNTGFYGNAYGFRAGVNSLETTTAFGFGEATQFTWEAWVFLEGTSCGGGYCRVINQNGGTLAQGLAIDNTDQSFVYEGGASGNIDSGFVVPARSWTYLVVTQDGSQNIRMYANGTLVATGTGQNGADAANFEIGGQGAATQWNGLIDEVRISRGIARSDDYVRANANATLTFLGEESMGPVITINSPTNTTTSNTLITFNFSARSQSGNASFTLRAYDNGVLIHNNVTYLNNTIIINTTTKSDGVYNFTVVAEDPLISTSTVIYTIDTVRPTVVITSPANNTAVNNFTFPFNYAITDSGSGIDSSACRLSVNGGANITLTGCLNTTATVNAGSNQTLRLYVADMAGNQNSTMHLVNVDPTFNISVRNAATLAYLSSFSVNVRNATFSLVRSTSSGMVRFNFSEAPLGSVSIDVSSTGFNTSTFSENINNTAVFNRTYDLSAVGMTIRVFDENNPSQQLHWNGSISNGTHTLNVVNAFTFQASDNGTVPTGQDLTILINSLNFSGYPQREFHGTFTSSQSLNLTAYLLSNDDGVSVTFLVKDVSEAPISGATVTVSRTISGSSVVVSQKLTDGTGQTAIFLDPEATYTVVVSKAGFTSVSFSFTPTSPFFVTVVLGSEQEFTPDVTFQGFSFDLIPRNSFIILEEGGVGEVIFTTQGTVEWFSLELIYNGTQIFFQNDTSGTDGTITGSFNLTDALNMSVPFNLAIHNSTNGFPRIITANAIFKRENTSPLNVGRNFRITGSGGAFERIVNLDADVLTKNLIWLALTVLVVGGVSLVFAPNPVVVVWLATVIMSAGVMVGYVSDVVAMLMVMLAVALTILLRR